MRIIILFCLFITGNLIAQNQIQLQISQEGFGNNHGLSLFIESSGVPVYPSGEIILDTVFQLNEPMSAVITNKNNRYTKVWLEPGKNVVVVKKSGFPESTTVEGSSAHTLFKTISYSDDQAVRQKAIEENLNHPMVIEFLNQRGQSLDSAFLRRIYLSYAPDVQEQMPEVRAYLFPINSPPMKVGMKMYDFIGKDRNGESYNTEAYRGNFLLIDFAATACGPCWTGYPDLIEQVKNYPNLKILTVNEDDAKEAWQRIAASKNITLSWPVIWDIDQKAELFKLYQINGWPTFYLISPEGIILEQWMGSNSGKLERNLSKNMKP